MKALLTKGKVVIAGLMGDEAILQATRTNEADTNTAYERAVKLSGLPSNTRDVLQRGLEDERSLRVGHRPGGRPALDETATGSLSRRKPGSIYPPAERSKGGPRLSPGKRFYRIASLDHLVSC